MIYRYKGKEYRLDLNKKGQIVNRDFDLVCDTANEVQAKIRQIVNAEHSEKTKILTFGNGYDREECQKYHEGTTTGIGDHWGVWVSWKEAGRNERAKMSTSHFWPDTPENRSILDAICKIRKQRADLEEQEGILTEQLTTLPAK